MSNFEDEVIDPFNQPAPQPKRVIRSDRVSNLNDLDLEDELLKQYNTAKNLYEDAEFDEEVPLNQKAQTLNAISAILGQIIKQREMLHNVQTITAIEQALVATLKDFPEVKEGFMTAYGRNLA